MSRHKLRFLPRYRNPSPLVGSNKRTEHRCALMLCAAVPSLKARTGVRSLARIIRSERGDEDQSRLCGQMANSVFVHYGLNIVCGVAYLVSLSGGADFQDY